MEWVAAPRQLSLTFIKGGGKVSEERLSKLQKWILMTLYKEGFHYQLRRSDVVWLYCQRVKKRRYYLRQDQVSITRSIRNLCVKGYIGVFGGPFPQVEFDSPFTAEERKGHPGSLPMAKYVKRLWLSEDKGIAKAKELVNVNIPKVNIKEREGE